MIPLQWTSNVINNLEEKNSFNALLQNNQQILNRLLSIIEEREATLLNALFSSSPPEEVALYGLLGRIAELREFKKLLNIT